MSDEPHEERVFAVFRETFSLSSDVDRSTLLYNASPAWDSIGHMTLVAALEEEFGCMLETDEILDMSGFAEAVRIMGRYRVAAP